MRVVYSIVDRLGFHDLSRIPLQNRVFSENSLLYETIGIREQVGSRKDRKQKEREE